jgi:GAF domain-containing protein
MLPPLQRLDDVSRLALLRGQVVDEARDPELDALVEEASRLSGAPIALVSLILKRQQLFRAQVGLPADLAATRATSRYVSFCQYVVAGDAPVVIEDTSSEAALPKDLVQRYGIRSYAGVPLRVQGQPLGSLCVIDTVPRTFDKALLERLAELGSKASLRLEQLSRRPRTPVDRVMSPAVAEARNHLAALRLQGEAAQQSLVELLPLIRLLKMASQLSDVEVARALRSLTETAPALDEVRSVVADMVAAAARLGGVVEAIGDALLDKPGPVTLGRVVQGARALCSDLIRLGGGLEVASHDPQLPLGLSYAEALLQLCRALVEAFDRGRGGAQLSFAVRPLVVDLIVRPKGSSEETLVPLLRLIKE